MDNYFEKKNWNKILTHQIGGDEEFFKPIEQLLNRIIKKKKSYDHRKMLDNINKLQLILSDYDYISEEFDIPSKELDSFMKYLSDTKSNEEEAIKVEESIKTLEIEKMNLLKEQQKLNELISHSNSITENKVKNITLEFTLTNPEEISQLKSIDYKKLKVWMQFIDKINADNTEHLKLDYWTLDELSVTHQFINKYSISLKFYPLEENSATKSYISQDVLHKYLIDNENFENITYSGIALERRWIKNF